MDNSDDLDESLAHLDGADLRAARKDAALDLRADGLNKSEIAVALGIERHTLNKWLKADKVFAANWVEASRVSVERLAAEAERRALAGSDKLLMFLLCNYAPDRFSQTQKIEHSGALQLAQAVIAARRRAKGQADGECPLA